jgi:hypothetical protein
MPKHSYQLINPIIEGTFRDVYDANRPIEGAQYMWKNLTEHIVSHVPKFMFTMRNISSGDLHHFEVAENKETSSFTINELNLDIDNTDFDTFEKNVDEYGKIRDQNNDKDDNDDYNEQDGGRKRYDDSSSSSSSSSSPDIYPTIRRTSPVSMFHYTPRVYYTNIKQFKSTMNPQLVAVQTPVFTPVFRPSLGTFIGIWP